MGNYTVKNVGRKSQKFAGVIPYTSVDVDGKTLKQTLVGIQGRVDTLTQAVSGIQGRVDKLEHTYISLEKLRKYLYRVTFDKLPEDNGEDGLFYAGCSSYVHGGKLYRNLDSNYDESASFIIRCNDFEGMSFITGLNDGILDETLISQLPYRVVDGRSNNGIMVSTHILFNDWSWTGAGSKSISLTRLPFLVLSKVRSMATIASDLDGVLGNLYASKELKSTGYLIQVLVTDGTTTYAILPPTSEGQSFILQDITSNPKLANFRWVNRASVSRADSDIQTRPTGIERFNAMPCELSDLRFTKAYEQSDRLSEFIGLRDTTKTSTDEELTAIYEDAHEAYLERSRNGETWQTMHSVVYGDKMEQLYIQENWDDSCVQDITADITCMNLITLASVSGGSISASTGVGYKNQDVTLTAIADEGYEFTSWSVKKSDNTDVTVTGNTFVMPDKPVTISAVFTAIP